MNMPPQLSSRRATRRRRPREGRRARAAARLRVGPPESVTPAAPSDPRAAMSSPDPLPKEIHRSAERGELQKVIKWLRKGGLIGALCPTTSVDGRATAETLLRAAAVNNHLEMVRVLLKRGASVDLPSGT